MEAFEHLGGVPREILYDRMKTAVLGELEKHIVYNAKLVAFAQHYSLAPRACKAYWAKTTGKVERPYRYIRQDFFLARRFQNLGDSYLRTLLIHGARSVIRAAQNRTGDQSWLQKLLQRRSPNVVAVALANKNA